MQRSIKQAERQLSSLDSASGQQELKLQKASFDTLKAYRWLLENQNKFEKEVFGPPIVTCSITDPKFADAVESLFQKTDFTSFTVQTRNDFRTLQHAINQTLGLHDISIRTCSLSLDTMRAPMPNDQLVRLGFDGWARDFLVGPDPVIAMLCSEKNLHSTPIGLREISNEVFARLEEGLMSTWVSGKISYQVTRRREYGPGATSTRVREIKPAQVWTAQPVDLSLKREHQENITLWNEQLQDIKDKLASEGAAVLKIREEHEQAEREMVIFVFLLLSSHHTNLCYRKTLRKKRVQNRQLTLSTGQSQRRSVCSISCSSAVWHSSNSLQLNKRPNCKTLHRCLKGSEREFVKFATGKTNLQLKRLRPLSNML